MKICVVGIGYVGLVTAGCLAEAGNNVVCVDNNSDKIASLKSGEIPIYEPGLAEMVKHNEKLGRLHFTADLKEGVDKYPLDQQFHDSFLNHEFEENDRTRYYLGVIEEKYFCHGGHKVNKSGYGVHIEHIFPLLYCQSLIKNWLKPLNITEEEHKNYRKRIGNLTLLEAKPNISASNNSFKVKKEHYKTDIKMTHELLKHDKWDIKTIKERSKELADIAIKIWRF